MGSVGKLWVSFKRTHQRTHEVTLWTNPVGSLRSNYQCILHVPEPLIESSFKKYPEIWPQLTQPYTQRVLWEFVVKLDQIESLLRIHLNEPPGYIEGKSQGIFWKNSQWVAQAHGGHIQKEPSGFIENLIKECLMGSLMGSFKTYSQLTHWSHQDQSGE